MPTETPTETPMGQTRTTGAVVAQAGAPFALQDLTLAPPRPDEVMVALEACGMCHADLSAQGGSIPFPLPGVLGHEGVGHVVAIGADVKDVAVGQRVVMSFTSCGVCPACAEGRPGYCVAWPVLNLVGGGRADGSSSLSCAGHGVHSHFFGQSSFARHAVTAARAVVPVPEDLPATVLAPMGCGVQTGVCAATDVLAPKAGDRVAIFGAGAVGLAALMGLGLTQAAQIIAVDIHQGRLDLARELGATHTIDASTQDVAAEIARITDGAGLDGVIETSGNLRVLEGAIAALAAGGTCVVIGVPGHGERASFDVIDLVARGLRIVGTNQGDANPRVAIPRLVELYRQGVLPIEKLVTVFPFDQINEARAASLDGRAIKPVMTM
ncbi:NAD(P)-dependent alcohol dehydrogenase [Novosphingobium terrae]|uniref:NAD(P)-dependent alcohol dehydrogenase n=1 Tax=Novosphingobium terrae TaxID=2726189 RepID=UPI001F132DDC|nr:NAD(P)-dependent alcohol dehydrogenase [Novosphingobium terrae]